MELQTFIEQTIKEITTAIHNSSKEMLESKTGKGIPDANQITITFDVAVTVGNNNSTEAGAKINVLGPYLSFGATKQNLKDFQQVSRLNFIVPVKIHTIDEQLYSVS